MRTINLCVVFILATLSQPLLAQQSAETSDAVVTAPGAAMGIETTKATATVVGIDPAARMVTLKRPNGKVVNVNAGNEVQNFDQIKVGDTVAAEYTQALAVDLKKDGSGIRESVEREGAAGAPAGAKPGGAVKREVAIYTEAFAVAVVPTPKTSGQ
jgi:Cu/Ag efflux protein CusF